MGETFLPNDSTTSTWIWYPGDFEIWLSNKMQVRRTERVALFLCHYVFVKLNKKTALA